MAASKQNSLLLFIIVFSQFAGTSLWFAGNAIVDQISGSADHANITSIVQSGFIAGTLIFSFLTIADRFNSPGVFFFSALMASMANLLIIWLGQDDVYLAVLRFTTGFFLAGIYPIGMKIAADLFPQKLGKVLGFLVGALVLGTALPHLVRSQLQGINWEVVVIVTSLLAVFGGILIFTIIPRTARPTSIAKPDVFGAFNVFRSKAFRSVAFGYFGHMWELYAFWSILPLLFSYHNQISGEGTNVYFWSFLVIAAGGAGCAVGGMVSQKIGSKSVAFYSLFISGLCCVLSPFLFGADSLTFFLFFLIWGFSVTADSPQFSALVARNAEEKHKGTALSIVTSLGFAITIISIQLLKGLFEQHKEYALWLLAIGPIAGLVALKPLPGKDTG